MSEPTTVELSAVQLQQLADSVAEQLAGLLIRRDPAQLPVGGLVSTLGQWVTPPQGAVAVATAPDFPELPPVEPGSVPAEAVQDGGAAA
ncbi:MULTISPECIES: hypothetical protein [unclassified Kitasatospora]|uniref:hypothetical protein n=1 Tax=unclassified Kitasatospora TaxID=2633591 RepID=UPI00070FDE2C|nr:MULTISPECIES: hypothetical protein [unclassified Kitasatospora]KQV18644.1 hypothetical protein ASC99_05360 [Kitasatospora sp. Root107]KRB74626.1 hypothetical protein ASE03_19295 [Kitasatospora sp. Root187]